MSEMGETFEGWREMKQKKRASNRETSIQLLIAKGVNIQAIKNIDAHVIVNHNGRAVDFWPGTGLWIDRATKRKGRGVRNLIQFVSQEPQS